MLPPRGNKSTLALQVDVDLQVNLARSDAGRFSTCNKCNGRILKQLLESHERFCHGTTDRQVSAVALSPNRIRMPTDVTEQIKTCFGPPLVRSPTKKCAINDN